MLVFVYIYCILCSMHVQGKLFVHSVHKNKMGL